MLFNGADESSKCLGSVVMLNPGSATPINTNKDIFATSNADFLKAEVALDQTMHSVKNMLYFYYGKEIKGYFNILNLFNLKNENAAEALMQLRDLKNSNSINDYLFYDIKNLNKTLASSPFVWLAWGANLTQDIESIIYENLALCGNKNVFYQLKKGFPHVKHPLYMTYKQRDSIKFQIEQLNKL